jgi:nitrate reductase cytochrome c-type subunit
MKIKKTMVALLVSALCLGTIAACSKSDQTADDVAYLRKQKETEVAAKQAADKAFEAEQKRAKDHYKNKPLP